MSSAERDPSAVPRRAAGMAWQTIDGETVLLNVDGRELMGVNEVGARIWALVDGARSIGEVARAIADEFEVAAPEALADVRAFLADLEAAGAVEF